MRLLRQGDITSAMARVENRLSIDPLLDPVTQLGEVSVDLRLGYDFLVSVLTRNASIDLMPCVDGGKGVATHFQSTRRDFGDKFILYPGQIVIGTTLEYLALPNNVLVDVMPRSSFSRLGIGIQSFTQPAYRGCISIEIFNHGNIPVELVVGCRILQARFYEIDSAATYGAEGRKYFAAVRPILSRASNDQEIGIFQRVASGLHTL